MRKFAALLALALLCFMRGWADVYIVIYATTKEKTGHAGIAVDRYQIESWERKVGEVLQSRTDTIPTGELTYYDLWPFSDAIPRDFNSHDVEPRYYRLPGSSSEKGITVESLSTKGIPHKEGYPCDGLIRIRTCPARDIELIAYLDRIIDQKRPFNAWTFNCVDFVLLGVEWVFGRKIDAEETLLSKRTATPNRLYKALCAAGGTDIVKNADSITSGSFWEERVLPAFMPPTERIRR